MEIGQPTPASAWEKHMKAAARATCAPGRGSRQGREWSSWEMPSLISSCHEGWNSGTSTRFP